MESETKGKKPSSGLNIISSNVNHKGFGAGSIDLSNVAGIIIDGDEAYVDNGTLHAKSRVEKGLKFSADRSEVPNGRKCWIVWVAVDRDAEGSFYGGLAACEMAIDTEAKRGWKILADHVNRMDKAMKRQVLVDGLDDKEKSQLRALLESHNAEWWVRTPEAIKAALA